MNLQVAETLNYSHSTEQSHCRTSSHHLTYLPAPNLTTDHHPASHHLASPHNQPHHILSRHIRWHRITAQHITSYQQKTTVGGAAPSIGILCKYIYILYTHMINVSFLSVFELFMLSWVFPSTSKRLSSEFNLISLFGTFQSFARFSQFLSWCL